MDVRKKLELVKKNTEEVVTEEELRDLLEEKQEPVAYIGYAPTGRLHIGHMFNLMKMAGFLDAGFRFKFLVADLHAYLDDKKSPFELLSYRSEYTEKMVRAVMKALDADTSKLEFIKGSDFQLKEKYTLDVLRMEGEVTFNRAKRAASEVVRFGDNPKLGGFIYPLMQIEDFVKLGADVAFGGIDQRGIYMLGREILPDMDYDKPTCVFSPLLPGLMGDKMSASEQKGKIDLLDDEDKLNKKIGSVYCPAGQKENNPLLTYTEKLVFPLLEKKEKEFLVERPEKYGGDVEYEDYKQLEKDFVNEDLHPQDLKKAFAQHLAEILEPVREVFKKKENKELLKKAYED